MNILQIHTCVQLILVKLFPLYKSVQSVKPFFVEKINLFWESGIKLELRGRLFLGIFKTRFKLSAKLSRVFLGVKNVAKAFLLLTLNIECQAILLFPFFFGI